MKSSTLTLLYENKHHFYNDRLLSVFKWSFITRRKNLNALFSYINPMVVRGSRPTTKIGFSSVVLGKCCASLPGSRTKRRPS